MTRQANLVARAERLLIKAQQLERAHPTGDLNDYRIRLALEHVADAHKALTRRAPEPDTLTANIEAAE